jgi:hypothetical protein
MEEAEPRADRGLAGLRLSSRAHLEEIAVRGGRRSARQLLRRGLPHLTRHTAAQCQDILVRMSSRLGSH